MSIERIEKKSISEEVYRRMLNNILNGTWKSGEKLPSESELCDYFNVSKVSIRSAIQKLRGKNLIVTMQGRGSFVKNSKGSLLLSNSLKYIDMTEDEYREIMEFRQAIEFRSFDLIQKYGTKEDYDLIESALKTMDHYAKKENYEPIKFNTADFEFHYSIIKGSKNNLFISIMNDYKDIILYCFNSTIDNIDIIIDRNVIADHYEIFNAIKSGNGNLAKEIMIKNNEKNRLYSKNYFKKKS